MKIFVSLRRLVSIMLISHIILCLSLTEEYMSTASMVIILIVLLVLFLIVGMLSAGRTGVPNNAIDVDKISCLPAERICRKGEIVLEEQERKVWKICGFYSRFPPVLDMRGWLFDKIYVRHFFAVIWALYFYNHSDQRYITLPFGGQKANTEKLYLKFVYANGKVTYKCIVKNYSVKKSASVRLRLFGGQSNKRAIIHDDETMFHHYKVGLTDVYWLKKI